MSFILDALKKLEQKRQQATLPDLMTVHGTEHHPRGKRMLLAYLLLIALLLNAGILLAWLQPWKTETAPPPVQARAQNEQQYEAAPAGGEAEDFDNSNPVKKSPPVTQKPVMTKSDSAFIKTAPVAENILSHAKATSAESKTNNAPLKSETDAPEPEVDEDIDPSDAGPLTQEVTAPYTMDMSRNELDTLRSTIRQEQNVTEDNAPMPSDQAEDVNTSADNSIREFSQLPSEIKEALPDMSISGHIYSNNPMSRMVNINGSIIREGENVTGGLTVDKITLSGVIFTYKGFRFTMRAF